MMMNPKEFMIGNLVLDSGQVAVINAIEEHRVSTDKGKYPYSMLDEIEPIELSTEWFIKLGGMEIKGGFIKLHDRLFIHRGGIYCDYGSDTPLPYVHNLQNLIYAVKKTEVTLNVWKS